VEAENGMADGQEGPDYWPIVEDIRRQISEGELGRGQKLPSLPKLQLTYGKTEGIVRRALAELRVEGLVSSHQGKGYFVRTDAAPHSEFQQLTQMLNETQEKLEELTQRVEELERDRER
jgi:DNA-binding GntR family transcriptional regulator